VSRNPQGPGTRTIDKKSATRSPADQPVEDMNILDLENDEVQKDAGGGYAWEGEFQRSWDVLQEDESGSLRSVVNQLKQAQMKRRRLRDTKAVQRGIIRHIYLVVDLSNAMNDTDLKPTRLDLTISLAEAFVQEFFDQNPISQLGIIVTRDGLAEKVSELGGNPMEHLNALQNRDMKETRGEPSLQNALELARGNLLAAPTQGTKEVVICMASLTSNDPGDIYNVIERCKLDGVRISIISLAAEVFVGRYMCEQTGGLYSVVMNEGHYKDLLFEIVPPPAMTEEMRQKYGASMILMGFPTRVQESNPSICSDHQSLTRGGYLCPRCGCKVCDLPTDCPICSLTLVSSPHLARSYHHLFPVQNFAEVLSGGLDEATEASAECFACLTPFDPAIGQAGRQGTGKYACPVCRHWFCLDCDLYVHESLHVCPGCTCMLNS
jgi:transcription initiation factor TFIIH subunit 2